MTFKERLWNQVLTIYDNSLYKFVHMPYQQYMYSKFFPDAKRSFDEMYKNTSIMFINNHFSHSFPRPHQANQIEIGGIHVKPAKPLPSDLQEFMDSASDGVIFFSMGSFIDGTDWPVEKREAFIRIFSKLKQKVIWRYSNDTLPNNPGNIKIGSWLPQRDILAHQNVKVFITHGGLLGTTEAIIEGVPVLGIPIFGDQKMNTAKAVARGYGLEVAYNDVSEETISHALNELLSNPKYSETAKMVSKTFNDRPMTPQESVVYWTEYAVRHRGAPHLQPYSINLGTIEFHMIDVNFVLFAILVVVLYAKYRILKFILRKIFQKSEMKKKKTQ
jgi:glucuronosyltransferase